MGAKILVIGLDGFTPAVLEALFEQNRLPHLGKLCAQGTYCALRSTLPANSAPAWVSSRTGVNPGKHGIFSFFRYEAYQWTVAASTDILAPSIEQILSRRGFRVCCLNIPLSYPPQPVNGVLFSGLPTPPGREDYVYPRALHHELHARGIDFPVDGVAMIDTTTPSALVRQLTGIHERRRAVTQYLLARESWDLFWVVFTMADKLQHLLWQLREEWLSAGSSAGGMHPGSAVDTCYHLLDETVGLLLHELDDSATVIVLSDHGFGPCKLVFQPNLWLRAERHLRLLTGHRIRARSLRFYDGRPSCRKARLRIEVGHPCRRINWGRTRAFSGLYVEPIGVRLNLKGREPQGIVPHGTVAERLRCALRDELSSLVPPGYDARAVSRLLEREELYHGPFVDRAPDLILDPGDSPVRFQGEFTRGDIFASPGPWPDVTGSHRPFGVLLTRRGDNGAGLDARDRHIVDIAPTILALLGESVPRYMDGTPLFS
jgi:predicted AlkP superfamily phosphohydrolase/phosphomutase